MKRREFLSITVGALLGYQAIKRISLAHDPVMQRLLKHVQDHKSYVPKKPQAFNKLWGFQENPYPKTWDEIVQSWKD